MNNTINRTTNQQNHEHEQGIENNNNNNINNSYYYYYLDTEPGVRERDEYERRRAAAREQLSMCREEILQRYQDALGIPLSNVVANMMIDFIMSGHTVLQLTDAIERTAFAPKPSPAYLRCVLQNFDTYGYFRPERSLPF